jgi:hypothetical protein
MIERTGAGYISTAVQPEPTNEMAGPDIAGLRMSHSVLSKAKTRSLAAHAPHAEAHAWIKLIPMPLDPLSPNAPQPGASFQQLVYWV